MTFTDEELLAALQEAKRRELQRQQGTDAQVTAAMNKQSGAWTTEDKTAVRSRINEVLKEMGYSR